MHVARPATATAAAFLLLPFTAAAAFAAPPSNDTPSGATPVTIGQSITENTTEATTDAADAALNANCGAPATGASVWFTYTDTTGAGFLASTEGSSYSSGVLITQGDPADGNLVACAPTAAGVRGEAGTTYYIMAFNDSAQSGGNLTFSVSALPPAPVASLTVDPKGFAYKDGSAKISGTYSCTNADGFNSDVEGTLTQRVGRTKINGFFFVYPLECDGAVHTWEAVVASDTGLFAGGKAANFSLAFACGLVECSVVEASGTVQLSRSGK